MARRRTIYLVVAETGGCSDHEGRVVAWYPTRADAEAHATAAREEVERMAPDFDYDYGTGKWGKEPFSDESKAAARTPLDPERAAWQFSSLTYDMVEVERGKWPFLEQL